MEFLKFFFCIRHLILRPGDSFGSVKHRGHCQGRCWSPWTKQSNCFATQSSEFVTKMIRFICEPVVDRVGVKKKKFLKQLLQRTLRSIIIVMLMITLWTSMMLTLRKTMMMIMCNDFQIIDPHWQPRGDFHYTTYWLCQDGDSL